MSKAAQDLNIRTRYLEALETEKFDCFPADVYTKGFIRNYADYLGLDADTMVMKYILNFKEEEEQEEEIESRGLLYGILVGIIIICAFVLVFLRFAWVHADYSYFSSEEVEMEVERRLAEIKSRQDGYTAQSEGLQLRVFAREKTWIYVIFDGMRKREMMLHPGDEVTWRAEDTIRVRLGNAGGIEIYYQGYPLEKLGESGQVTDKIITLDNDQLRVRPVGRFFYPEQ